MIEFVEVYYRALRKGRKTYYIFDTDKVISVKVHNGIQPGPHMARGYSGPGRFLLRILGFIFSVDKVALNSLHTGIHKNVKFFTVCFCCELTDILTATRMFSFFYFLPPITFSSSIWFPLALLGHPFCTVMQESKQLLPLFLTKKVVININKRKKT